MSDDKTSKPNATGTSSSTSGGASGQKPGSNPNGTSSAPTGPSSGVSGATPNRDKPREAPVIDAKPGDFKESKPEAKSDAKPASKPAETGPKGPIAALAASGPLGAAGAAKTDTKPTEAKPGEPKPASGATATASSSGPASSAAAAKTSPSPADKSSNGKPPEKKPAAATGNADAGKKSGFGAMAAASLAGAVIALAGSWGLQSTRGADPAVSELAGRIGANETALAALKKTPAVDLAPLDKRVAALENVTKQQTAAAASLKADIDKLAAATPAGTPVETSGQPSLVDALPKLETRIAALEKALSAPKSNVRATADPAAKKPAATPEAAGTDSKTAAALPADAAKTADAKTADAKPAGDQSPASPASGATAQVAGTAVAATIPDAIAKLPPEVTKLAARLQALEGRIKPPVDLGPVNDKLVALEKKFEPLANQVDSKVEAKIAPIATAIAKSSATIASNTKAIAAAGEKADSGLEKANISLARSNAAGTAIVARTLVQQVAAGKPFDGLVSAIEAMGAKGEALEVLKPLAAKGVAANASLAAAFKGLRNKIIEPAPSPAADAPILDRLKHAALGMVKVRPAGETTSATPGALFVRTGSALGKGDMAAAKALYDKLPEKARNNTKDWAAMLQSRIAAENAAQSILSDALKLLQQQKS